MQSEIGSAAGPGTAILAAAAFVGAMLMAGLLTAFQRISGLYRHGLIEDRRLGSVLHEYLQSPRRFLTTASTLYLVMTALGFSAWSRLLAHWWPQAGVVHYYLVLVVSLVVVWFLGGLLLKKAAAGAALAFGRWTGALLFPLYWLLRPWCGALGWLVDKNGGAFGTGDMIPHLSQEEIHSLLEEEDGQLALEHQERDMIHSIFEFHGTAVREIMVPRIDMVSLEASDPVAAVIPLVNAARHSRIPVHEGSVDRVVGILYAKDLLALIQDDRLVAGGKVVGDLIRPAYFIPESKKIDEVLAEFRTKRIHMAIVIDEYGGTAGLVTLEDVLEEIVGEIEDEFDQDETLFEWIDDRSLRLDPKIDLEDLQELVGVPLPAAGSETLGGLIYEAAGKVPESGEEVAVAGFAVRVEKVVDQRILQVVLSSAEPLPGYARRDELD